MNRQVSTSKDNKAIWFPAKTYGVGWGLPVAWQGWVVLVAYLALTLAGIFLLTRSRGASVWFLPYVLTLTLLLLFICWKKGEKLEWRWGRKE